MYKHKIIDDKLKKDTDFFLEGKRYRAVNGIFLLPIKIENHPQLELVKEEKKPAEKVKDKK